MTQSGTERLGMAGATHIRGCLLKVMAVTVLLAHMLLPIGSVRAQDAEGVLVAVPIIVKDGQTVGAAVEKMREIGAYIAKQPGLIDTEFLGSKLPNNRPSHIYVSRWQSFSHFEELFNSQEFLDLLEASAPYFDFRPAEVFTTVP